MSVYVLERLKERFGDTITDTHTAAGGDEVAVVKPEAIRDVITFLKTDPDLAMDMPSEMTCVDYLGKPNTPRFGLVYQLYSTSRKHRVRVKAYVPEEAPEIDTVSDIFPGWDWFEREVWDLYGVKFIGHPDHRRVLLWEGFPGHPLRKDYAFDDRPPIDSVPPPEKRYKKGTLAVMARRGQPS
jgi:NADH-quinone oxidoreductase subunit C